LGVFRQRRWRVGGVKRLLAVVVFGIIVVVAVIVAAGIVVAAVIIVPAVVVVARVAGIAIGIIAGVTAAGIAVGIVARVVVRIVGSLLIIWIRGLLIVRRWLGGSGSQIGGGGGILGLISWRCAWLRLGSVVWGRFIASGEYASECEGCGCQS